MKRNMEKKLHTIAEARKICKDFMFEQAKNLGKELKVDEKKLV